MFFFFFKFLLSALRDGSQWFLLWLCTFSLYSSELGSWRGGHGVRGRGAGQFGTEFFRSGDSATKVLQLRQGVGNVASTVCAGGRGGHAWGGMWTRDMAPRQGSNQRSSARSTTVQVNGGTTHKKKKKKQKVDFSIFFVLKKMLKLASIKSLFCQRLLLERKNDFEKMLSLGGRAKGKKRKERKFRDWCR